MTVLTYDNAHYYSNYSRRVNRPNLIGEYHNNMVTYLKKKFPEVPEDKLREQVVQITKERYQPIQVEYIEFPEPGNAHQRTVDLLEFTNEFNEDIMTPYGATYLSTKVAQSMFTGFITEEQAARKVVKGEELAAEVAGDKVTQQLKGLRQLAIKIGINVLSGVMLSNVAFRSGINYNAITSTARFNAMVAYAITEMVMESNYHFYDESKAINWIVNLLRVYPGDQATQRAISRYQLPIPGADQVYAEYLQQVNQYDKFEKGVRLKELIDSVSSLELGFIYYGMNLKRLFAESPKLRSLSDEIVNIDELPLLEGNLPQASASEDEIIQTMTSVMVAEKLPPKATLDTISKDDDLNRRFITTYQHLEGRLQEMEELFHTFIMLPIVPSEASHHKNMVRKMVLLSDTDSILFTTKKWVEWYTGDITIDIKSNRFNAFVIGILSKLIEHVFAYTSAAMNIDEVNLRGIAWKNEFVYDIFLRTPIAKHYAGFIRWREGMKLDPYKMDLKGKNFRGSDLPKETTKFVESLIKRIFNQFLNNYTISPEELLKEVIGFEQRIKKSVDHGDNTFLAQGPINLKRDYKKPESSNYLFYELWEAVFADTYGSIYLPQKCKELPIRTVSLKDRSELENMKNDNPEMYRKFVKFLERYPKRKFQRVLFPAELETPLELRRMANYRKVCKINCYSIELILRSFNLVNYPANNTVGITLFSDLYPHLLQEVYNETNRKDHGPEEDSAIELLEDEVDPEELWEYFDEEE